MSPTKLCTALVAFGLLAAAPPGDTDASEGQSFKLKHKAHKGWEFFLPKESWKDAAKGIELPGGLVFETEVKGINRIDVDINGDGGVDKAVRSSGFLTLRAKNEEGELVKYSIRIRNSGARRFEWTTGSSMSGKVAGSTLNVFDQNCNGSYDDWGIDAVTVGSDKSAALLSKVIRIGGDLYNFDITAEGGEVTVSPFKGETGTLNVVSDFEAKGKLTAAVFQDGDLSFCVAGARKGLAVPVGTYRLVSGRVEKGSASASIRRGKMQNVSVSADEESCLEWGADVSGEFSFRQTGEKVTVNPDFNFFGAAGEEYYDFQPRGKGPKIIIRDQKRGKELKTARFPES